MNRSELLFERPSQLAAQRPAEADGRSRDGGRLLVSTPAGQQHGTFRDLADYLDPGDLLVVNRSATLPASLPAQGPNGSFIINLSTDYGAGLWLVEPRNSAAQPGPVAGIETGLEISLAGGTARFTTPFPGIPRLWFIHFSGDVNQAMAAYGRPIRYGYLDGQYDLSHFQTIFAAYPGSAEMPSAAYPFTRRVVDSLVGKGVEMASIILHTGVSSQEVETEVVENHPLYPEPYCVPQAAAAAVNKARAEGRRVIALGTTVVRALETAWNGHNLSANGGFTRLYIHPDRGVRVIDGLITGLHDPVTSHLAMLYTIAGQGMIREAYAEAVAHGYHWHEFGDSHLILRR